MIDLTEPAATELAAILARKNSPPGTGLRLAISRGGCAGMQYVMAIRPAEPGDVSIEARGLLLHIAADSIDLLRGSSIDFSNSLSDAGFKIDNPNATRSCGCGTSFEARTPAPATFSTPADPDACSGTDH